jgi:predicted acyl esterase
LVVLFLLLCAELPLLAETPQFEIKREFGVRVPMRDGVTLAANLYLPDAPGEFPVILIRTPYDSGQPNYSSAEAYWASSEPLHPGTIH